MKLQSESFMLPIKEKRRNKRKC